MCVCVCVCVCGVCVCVCGVYTGPMSAYTYTYIHTYMPGVPTVGRGQRPHHRQVLNSSAVQGRRAGVRTSFKRDLVCKQNSPIPKAKEPYSRVSEPYYCGHTCGRLRRRRVTAKSETAVSETQTVSSLLRCLPRAMMPCSETLVPRKSMYLTMHEYWHEYL